MRIVADYDLKNMNPRIKELISESIAVKQLILQDEALLQKVEDVAKLTTAALKNDGKVLFCGNGGSASDAQHLAAELSGRFYLDREPLFAEALHVNTSYLTAVANDYSYDEIYSRLIRGKGRKGDVLFALSTSGNSANVIRGVEEAAKIGMTTIALTSGSGGKLKAIADHLIAIPTKDTMRTQEAHIMLGHLICELVETAIFGE